MPKARPRKSKPKRARGAARGRWRVAPVSGRAIEANLAELAHDIRTPLTGILALGELLATSELGAREREWAVAIKTTAEHLARLTSLIVDAARADAGRLVLRRDLIRVNEFAQSLAASLAARAESRGLACQVAIAGDLPDAMIGDSLRLRAAVENLIDNAVKFTARGSVRLDVESEPLARGRVRLIFRVTDSGIGLKAAEIKRLFRPFAQANEAIARRYGGAGLGLSYVKRIAKAMGGDLTVESEPGRGSSFRLAVSFASVVQDAAAGSEEARAARMALPRPLAILCAEDNPYGRVVLNTILTELGHRADFVGTGEAAVEAVAGGGYDAVLMDVTLPGIDGIEAARRIRGLAPPAGMTSIIGISGRASAADEAAARDAGMNGYLAKPLSPSALAAALAGAGPRLD
jgi:CheY-like chemotaxis protein